MGKESVLKYLGACGVIFVCSFASLLFVAPFGAGVFMGLVLSGLNPIVLSVVYVAGSLCFNFNWLTLVGAGIASVVFSIVKIIDIKLKKINDLVFYVVSPVSLLGFLPLTSSTPSAVILFLFFAPITMFVSHTFFNAVMNRGLSFKMLDSEYVCGGIIIILMSLALHSLDIYYFPIVGVFASILILIFGKVYGFNGAMIAGVCLAIGGALYDYQLIYFAYYPTMALLCGLFLPAPRILSALSNLIGYTLITFFFEISAPYAYLWLLSLLIGGIIFVLIPSKHLKLIKLTLNPEFSPICARRNINLLRLQTAQALFKTGDVFVQMSAYINQKEEILPLNLNGKLREGVCSKCPKNNSCSVTDEELNSVLQVSINKGRAIVSDLPNSIVSDCRLAPSLISYASKLADLADKKKEKNQSVTLAKTIVGEQLSGMGEVLKQMSNNLKTPISYDFEAEQKIKEELNYRGVCCLDCAISPKGITLTLNKKYANLESTAKILKKLTKADYGLISEEQTENLIVAFFAISPIFDAVFAVASSPKGEVSGDTHSFIKIKEDKLLVSLCDGMGSGVEAQKYAFNTVSLIECFYQAGFDHSTVINSVNRFLSLSREECFSACDIAIIDLNLAVVDIFKIGSPACYVKTNQSVKIIEGSSLPLGSFEDVRPTFLRTNLNDGDMLILLSDGIVDCLGEDSLTSEIASCSKVSPDSLVKQILNTAKQKSKTQRDDMTVVAVKIFSVN